METVPSGAITKPKRDLEYTKLLLAKNVHSQSSNDLEVDVGVSQSYPKHTCRCGNALFGHDSSNLVHDQATGHSSTPASELFRIVRIVVAASVNGDGAAG